MSDGGVLGQISKAARVMAVVTIFFVLFFVMFGPNASKAFADWEDKNWPKDSPANPATPDQIGVLQDAYYVFNRTVNSPDVQCLVEYPQVSMKGSLRFVQDGKEITFYYIDEKLSEFPLRIKDFDPKGKAEDAVFILAGVESQLCLVMGDSAKTFFDNRIARNCKIKGACLGPEYTPVDSIRMLNRHSILIGTKTYNFNSNLLLYKPDASHICIPVFRDDKLDMPPGGCDGVTSDGIDNDCIDKLRANVPICKVK